jgi:hypothetical protein
MLRSLVIAWFDVSLPVDAFKMADSVVLMRGEMELVQLVGRSYLVADMLEHDRLSATWPHR